MQVIACWCALLAVSGFPDREYVGPAYAARAGKVLQESDWWKREALILCVRAGLGPDQVAPLFGLPLVTSQDNSGPIEWWYPHLGVSIHWPPRLFKADGP